jgi:hypothetical protein
VNLQDLKEASAGWKTMENTLTKAWKVVVVDKNNEIIFNSKLVRYQIRTCHMWVYKMNEREKMGAWYMGDNK